MGKKWKGSGNGRSIEKDDINNNENIKGNNMDGEKNKIKDKDNVRTVDIKNDQVNYRKGSNGDNNNKQIGNNNGGKEAKECRNYNAGSCNYGDKCLYVHKEICRAWKNHGG